MHNWVVLTVLLLSLVIEEMDKAYQALDSNLPCLALLQARRHIQLSAHELGTCISPSARDR